MKKNSLYTHYQNIIRFGQDESGVYSIIMGLITVFLLIAISFTFEFSGMLMDKARLSDGLEQAALTVIAENNKDRSRDNLDQNRANQRNHWIADKYATLYLPGHNQPDLKVVCDKNYTGNSKNSGFLQESAEADITCAITGTVNRHTWLPISLNNIDVVPSQSKIGSYGLASKKTSEPLPFDIVFAVELSDAYFTSVEKDKFVHCSTVPANMRDDITKYLDWRRRRCEKDTGAQYLVKVLQDFSQTNLFQSESAASRNSRISFFPYNVAGQMTASRNRCIIPVVGISDSEARSYQNRIDPNSDEAYYEYTNKEHYGWLKYRLYINEPLHIFSSRKEMANSIQNALTQFNVSFGDTEHYQYVYFFLKYLPYYIDYRRTVDMVRHMTPISGTDLDNASDTSKGLYVNTNSTTCFQMAPDRYRMSSGWYDRNTYSDFVRFTNDRAQYSGGAADTVLGMLSATQHFVNLGRNTNLSTNQPTQRLLIMIGTGSSFGLGDLHNLQKKDWICRDRDPRTGRTLNPQTRCQDHRDSARRLKWIREHSRYYNRADDTVHIPNSPSGRKDPASEFNQIGNKLIEQGVCQAIRDRLDTLDSSGSAGRSKVIYINYLNRMTDAKANQLRGCVDQLYFASNRQELLDALNKSLERENSQSEEEVGKSRVFK